MPSRPRGPRVAPTVRRLLLKSGLIILVVVIGDRSIILVTVHDVKNWTELI